MNLETNWYIYAFLEAALLIPFVTWLAIFVWKWKFQKKYGQTRKERILETKPVIRLYDTRHTLNKVVKPGDRMYNILLLKLAEKESEADFRCETWKRSDWEVENDKIKLERDRIKEERDIYKQMLEDNGILLPNGTPVPLKPYHWIEPSENNS